VDVVVNLFSLNHARLAARAQGADGGETFFH
jgi:hypothetical protein